MRPLPRKVLNEMRDYRGARPEEFYGRLAIRGADGPARELWAAMADEAREALVRRVVLHWFLGKSEEHEIAFLRSVGEEWL